MKANVLLTRDSTDDDEFNLPPDDGRPRRVPQLQQRTGGFASLPSEEVTNHLIRQALKSLPHAADISPTEDARNKAATIDIMEAIEPKDAIEGMIAAQMVGLHNVTMECMRRAQFSTGPDRETLMAQINKTSRTFGMLIETLNKHRGKGRQTMVVEHVHVHQGGQAIVGQVEGTVSRAGANSKK